jgi:thiol-disulfide isomerase/thioredoxin
MRAMRTLIHCFLCLFAGALGAAAPSISEEEFRVALGVAPDVRIAYRGLDCAAVSFDAFAQAMLTPNVHADVDRSADGTTATVTARQRGARACQAPYPPIDALPPFALRDLAGKPIDAASLKGRPTLINFYFAECKPCILEVSPLNKFAASRRDLNFIAMTFDDASVARAFVDRYKFRWRVVPEARSLIDRIRVKSYPTMALFDANGRLLGTRSGGVSDELETVNLNAQLARWVDGLLRTAKAPSKD